MNNNELVFKLFLKCRNCEGIYSLEPNSALALRLKDGKQKTWKCVSCKYKNAFVGFIDPIKVGFKPWLCPRCSSPMGLPRLVDVTPFVKIRQSDGSWKALMPKWRVEGFRWQKCQKCGYNGFATTNHKNKKEYKKKSKNKSRIDRFWTHDLSISVAEALFGYKTRVKTICETLFHVYKHRISVFGFLKFHYSRLKRLYYKLKRIFQFVSKYVRIILNCAEKQSKEYLFFRMLGFIT